MRKQLNVDKDDVIVYRYITTKMGNILTMFYNRELNLLVVDLVAKDGSCGNELMRWKFDDRDLLTF